MQLPELLNRLGSQCHRERIAILLELGRRARDEVQAAELIGLLRRKGPYLRYLALFACQAAGRGDWLAESAAQEDSRHLRSLALRMAARQAQDPQILSLLERLRSKEQARLLQLLQKRRRQPLVDTWLASHPSPALRSFGGEALLEQSRDLLREQGNAQDWARIARRRPEWAAQTVPLEASCLSAVMIPLARLRHRSLFGLWQRGLEAGLAPAYLQEDRVLQNCSEELASWALQHSHNRWDWEGVCRRLSSPTRERLLEQGWLGLNWHWWRRLSPPERLQTWDKYRLSQADSAGFIGAIWLDRLPATRRQAEALVLSQLPAGELNPAQQMDYLALLDFDTARERLQTWMKDPDVDLRAGGLRRFTRLGRYFPERRGEVLEVLMARVNEADPVRGAFLEELAQLPPHGWQPSHFKALGEILKGLMGAADASAYSFAGAERLVLRIASHQPTWSAAWLGKLLRHWGRVSLGCWAIHLEKPGTAQAFQDELVAVAQEWIARERMESFFALVRALGRSLKDLAGLVRLLREVCASPLAEPARTALRLLWSQARSQCREFLPTLLAEDPSWVEESVVAQFLHRERQDLLDPFLGSPSGPMQGKFATGKTRWVLSFEDRFWRWTPDQQSRYAQQLEALVKEQGRDVPAQLGCVGRLSLMGFLPPTILAGWAHCDDSRQALRDASLRALARYDQPSLALPTLLEALDDNRARIAIYALRRLLLEMPPQQALEQLQRVNSNKITVLKEVARLLGDLEQRLGLPELLTRLQGENLHRDYRIACLRGLWPHLDQEEVWPPLEAAANSPERALGKALSAIPLDRHGPQARTRLRSLLQRLLAHPSISVRTSVLDRLARERLEDPEGRLVEAACAGLEGEREGPLAAAAILRTLSDQPERWQQVLREQWSRRLALKNLIDALRYHVRAGLRFGALAEVTLPMLQEDPALLVPWLTLLAHSRPLEDLLATVEQEVLRDPGQWDIPGHWQEWLQAYSYRLSQAHWEQIGGRWGEHLDARLRRLCLEALLLHARSFGWSADLRQRLEAFRQDHSALVAGKAQFTFPPPPT